MIIVRLVFSIVLLTISQIGIAQQLTKEVVINKSPYCKEVYHVLKNDKSIKHGDYEKTDKRGLLEKGQYHSNDKTGVWEFYNLDGELAQKYDFTNKKLVYDMNIEKGKTFAIEHHKYSRPPVLLKGQSGLYRNLGYQLRYPSEARRYGVQGVVLIKATITTDGKIINEEIAEGIGSGCNEEALRLIKLIPYEWIPALDKDGNPIESEVAIPIHFRLR
jgi:TonB family protein